MAFASHTGTAEAAERAAQMSRRLAEDCLARTREEALQLAEAGFACAGSAVAQVGFLKGELSDGELAGGELLGGADGAALRASLAKLGYPEGCWAALSTRVRTAGQPWRPASPEDLAWAIEVVDPELVCALDDEAARALQAAWGLDVPLEDGRVTRVLGRRVLALGGFEAALGDARSKQVMWARLKLVPPLGEPM